MDAALKEDMGSSFFSIANASQKHSEATGIAAYRSLAQATSFALVEATKVLVIASGVERDPSVIQAHEVIGPIVAHASTIDAIFDAMRDCGTPIQAVAAIMSEVDDVNAINDCMDMIGNDQEEALRMLCNTIVVHAKGLLEKSSELDGPQSAIVAMMMVHLTTFVSVFMESDDPLGSRKSLFDEFASVGAEMSTDTLQ